MEEDITKLMQLEELIVKWAEARKLIPLASPETQLMKCVSEIGELADAIAKKDMAGIKDAIGDIFVILIIWNRLKFNHPMEGYNTITTLFDEVNLFFTEFLYNFNDIFRGSIAGHHSHEFYFYDLLDSLAGFAAFY